jgi:hypothetical protein
LNASGSTGNVTLSNTGVISITAGTGISKSTTTDENGGQLLTLSNTGILSLNGFTGDVGITAGSGISINTASKTAISITNTGVSSFNGLTGAVTGVTTGSANTFGPLQRFTNGISASGGTFSRINVDSITNDSLAALTISANGGGINLSDGGSIILDTASPIYIGDYSGNLNSSYLEINDATLMVTTQNSNFTTNSVYLTNGEYLRNTTNGRVDIMPVPTGSTAYGMYFDMTSWGFGVIMGTVRSSDGALNTGGNFRFDVPLTILNDTRFQLGSDGHYGLYRTDTGNNTAQLFALSNNANNSGAFALVSYFAVGNANRSPTTSHTNPNLYIYANGTTSANDFIRFEHDNTNGNIVSGGTTGILIQPGSGTVGISGGVSAGAYILNSNGINAQTGTTYTILSTDNGEIITMNNGSPITVTVPSGLPVGFSTTIIQLGAGQVSFTTSGTTINSYQSYTKIAGQHGSASLVSYSSNVFNLAGSLSA